MVPSVECENATEVEELEVWDGDAIPSFEEINARIRKAHGLGYELGHDEAEEEFGDGLQEYKDNMYSYAEDVKNGANDLENDLESIVDSINNAIEDLRSKASCVVDTLRNGD
jgi:hypothetical protein